MKDILVARIKMIAAIVGALTPQFWLHRFQMVINYMKLGRWWNEHNFQIKKRVRDRQHVFAFIAKRIQDQRIRYLEFGVYQGASMRCWSKMLRHPDSKLHGFDSFEELPEDFCAGGGDLKGTFSTKGVTPVLEDPRITFFKGWFEDILQAYALPAHEVL